MTWRGREWSAWACDAGLELGHYRRIEPSGMARKKRNRKPRRTLDRLIADTEAQLVALKARAATQDRFDPKAVKAERDRLGLSAAHYAALVDVAPLTIYSWEQ